MREDEEELCPVLHRLQKVSTILLCDLIMMNNAIIMQTDNFYICCYVHNPTIFSVATVNAATCSVFQSLQQNVIATVNTDSVSPTTSSKSF